MGCQPWPQSAYGVWWQQSVVRRKEADVHLANVIAATTSRSPVPALAFAAAGTTSAGTSAVPSSVAGGPGREQTSDYYSPRPEPDEAPL